MRSLIAVAVAAAAVIVAPAASAGAKSPCVLVTADDAGKALGVKVGKGIAKSLGLYRSCTYTKGHKTLTVLVRKIDKATFEKSARKNPPPVFPIPGIGDEAFSAGAGAALLVWKQGTEVTFTFVGVSPVVQTQKDVANAALKRL